jgi:4a-hydroxytetrahydrobiopterin dehydratase
MHSSLYTHAKNHATCEGTAAALSRAELEEQLQHLSGWALRDERLHKRYDFGSFAQAMTFANRVAAEAERQDHHPAILVDKRRVELTIWTRKVNALTVHDFRLAAAADGLLEGRE